MAWAVWGWVWWWRVGGHVGGLGIELYLLAHASVLGGLALAEEAVVRLCPHTLLHHHVGACKTKQEFDVSGFSDAVVAVVYEYGLAVHL